MSTTFKPDLVVPEPWYGFDFNRTLAVYHNYEDDLLKAEPIPSMVELLKEYLALGRKVKIMSAQVWYPYNWYNEKDEYSLEWEKQAYGYYCRAQKAETIIKAWCLRHIGQVLEVTCECDRGCQEIWNDKAHRVIPNKGLRGQIAWEEVGTWPEPAQAVAAGNKRMTGMMTFDDAEVERMFFTMLRRREGHLPSGQWMPQPLDSKHLEQFSAADQLAHYLSEFPTPPYCAFTARPHPDCITEPLTPPVNYPLLPE